MGFQIENDTMATINVRIKSNLKSGGEEVLEREGISVSEAIRRFYSYLETKQSFPEFLRDTDKNDSQKAIEKKRAVLKGLVGVLPHDVSLEKARDRRFERQLRSGVQ